MDVDEILAEMRVDYPKARRVLLAMGWTNDELAETNDGIVAVKKRIQVFNNPDDVETLVCWRNWLKEMAMKDVGGAW